MKPFCRISGVVAALTLGAVMVACGRGFLVAQPQPPALRAFLHEEIDRFSCDQLPPDVHIGTEGLYQRPWRYLMTSVGLAWRLLGISWSGLGPLFGVFYGATTVLAYALFRQVAGRLASLVCAAALCLSPIQLANLPNLRDYAKAPFTVALVLILCALVLRTRRARAVLLLSLGFGVVMGIGYGFRADLLIDIPPFLVALALFLPGGVLRNVGLKAAAAALAAVGFLSTAWPIITTVVAKGTCQPHVFLLGLTTPFNEPLGVAGGAYSWGHLYDDEYMWANVSTYATRFRPDLGYIEFCSREYDAASWDYARHILATFPADIVTRAYAAVLHVLELPFQRIPFARILGPAIAVAFVLTVGADSLRLALFALFVILYFCGHPAIQFLPRHYFPFEFVTLAMIAFFADRGMRRVMSDGPTLRTMVTPARLRRTAAFAALAAVVLVLPLAALRPYQQARAGALLGAYAAAPVLPLQVDEVAPGQLRVPIDPHASRRSAIETIADLGRERARFLEVVVDGPVCRPGTTVTFRYDPAHPEIDFSHTVTLPASGAARVFEPIYSGFIGVDLSDRSPACRSRIALVDVGDRGSRFALLLSAILPLDWRAQPQYQHIASIR